MKTDTGHTFTQKPLIARFKNVSWEFCQSSMPFIYFNEMSSRFDGIKEFYKG